MSKHDTVIGYIEYLDSSGSVQERIPFEIGRASCRERV